MGTTRYLLAALAFAGVVATGCSSSSSGGSSDSGTDSPTHEDARTDGKTSGGGDSGKDGSSSTDAPSGKDSPTLMDGQVNPDAEGGTGCTFAGFITGIIKSPSDGTPSTFLGQTCSGQTDSIPTAGL